MDKERIDGFRSAFAPGETLFWQVPAAARERMAFYRENLPRLFLKKSRRYLRCPTTMRWNLCDFCRDRASASRRMCRSLALMIHWQAGIAAVGLCSNFTLIFSVMSGAVGTVAGILIAQFLGAEEHTEAWRSLDVSLVCGGVLAALFLLTAGGFPAQVLGLYTADDAIL